ncbi:DNA-3-methyladenine glycosylase [Desertibacillus haloalkaliphilus]|uniref:DNA-3-methyladenine glycosylase n=1 Tax=Desertibacillus haloalkaliphilus TaxID=1328930 RepID=UPI001C267A9A|nr:DNA-3-methyladenine glycosylase [Desertibacillus haloalkaliphilus]MBU8907932.1 DNA-3-methyladenine glycosylase [Desertibacillus haloalkaliphilus]
MSFLPVNRDFFLMPTLELAQSLLGMFLVKETEEGLTAGMIVETEAYIGPSDRAAHSFGNRRTRRTEVMFGPAGFVYTYVMHTHCLVNVVSGDVEQPEAVLIRAVEPIIGIELMYQRRGNKKERELTNGPGKLTKALGIVKEDYGRPLYEKPLFVAEGKRTDTISCGPRIGIDNSGEAKTYPWRFWIPNNRFVSR